MNRRPAQRPRRSVSGVRPATGVTLVADPAIDVVDICSPNYLHREMALAAIAAGKHIWCEKPLALDASEAREVSDAAVRAGIRHLIGFNYSCNPLIGLARDLIAAGELGTVTGFSGRYFEDYMADPAVPHSWRCERRYAGSGALADLGSHLIDMAEVLLGPIDSVQARLETIHRERRVPATGALLPVENEDIALALVRFASESAAASRSAASRPASSADSRSRCSARRAAYLSTRNA